MIQNKMLDAFIISENEINTDVQSYKTATNTGRKNSPATARTHILST